MTKASGSNYYYFQDALGSARNVVESDEDVANTYDYPPESDFASLNRAFGILITETENVDSPFEFTGREREPGGLSHLHYYRNRYYMPGNGIFTSRDAMWADIHRGWGYPGNNPVNLLDPWGLGDDDEDWKWWLFKRGVDAGLNYYTTGIYGAVKQGAEFIINHLPTGAGVDGIYLNRDLNQLNIERAVDDTQNYNVPASGRDALDNRIENPFLPPSALQDLRETVKPCIETPGTPTGGTIDDGDASGGQ